MRAFALIFFAVGASDAWALLDARRVRRSNRLLSTANFGQLKVTASDAATGDFFGYSVAIDGDTVVIGAYGAGTGGAVYVLRTSDGGATYAQVAKLTASDGAANDEFGISVAIDGDTIVVGAQHYNNGGSGVVYVFLTTDGGATYGQVAKLTAADAAVNDRFGYSVAIAGDTIVVGAHGDDDDGSDSGSAYVFRTTDGGATYGQVAKLTASDAASGDLFGFSVAIDGNTVVVGAWGDDGGGSAYVFLTTDGGATYNQVAKLTAADRNNNDHFGYSVAVDGSTIVVGARYDDDGGGDSGSAYVFRTSDGGVTYVEVAKLTADDAAASDNFGWSVAIDGDTIVIGAYDAGIGGAAYVFLTTDGGATYAQVAKLTAADAAADDYFGDSVAIDGDTIVVGADGDDDAGTRSGSAYVFSTTAALGSDSATRAGGTLATALLAFAATALAL